MEFAFDILSSVVMFIPELIGTAMDQDETPAIRWATGIAGGIGVTSFIGGFVALGYMFSQIGVS